VEANLQQHFSHCDVALINTQSLNQIAKEEESLLEPAEELSLDF
jgi:hypothetical protein